MSVQRFIQHICHPLIQAFAVRDGLRCNLGMQLR
jgi:hypothetical protein